jgi:hypothetical protein
MPIVRDWLKHAYTVALGIDERDILSHTGYLHRLAEHFTAGIFHFIHCFFDVIHRDDDRRILRGPIVFFRVKAPVDRAGPFGAFLVGFRGGCKDIISHVLAKHLRLPAECLLIKLRHTLSVVEWNLKVNDRVHHSSSLFIEAWFPKCVLSAVEKRGETRGSRAAFGRVAVDPLVETIVSGFALLSPTYELEPHNPNVPPDELYPNASTADYSFQPE